MKKIAIGGGQGFWGDSPDAAIHMIHNADIQYLACDYLAELTLSIMAKQQLKDPSKGYAPDFVTRLLKPAGKTAWERNIKILTNAGGMNISGCVDAIRQYATEENMKGYKIGYVTGDDIKSKIPQLLKDGWTFPNFDYEGDFTDIVDKIYNCNAYIGHEGIQSAIEGGADVALHMGKDQTAFGAFDGGKVVNFVKVSHNMFPDSVTKIKLRAFTGCKSLENVTI